MRINVKLSQTNKTKEIILETGSTVEELLAKIKLKPNTVIVMSNNIPIPVDDVLNHDQELAIIQVSSGG